MWVLIALQIMAGSATGNNSMPHLYSGVVMEEFSSEASCERAKKRIIEMNKRRNNGANIVQIKDGIIELSCEPK